MPRNASFWRNVTFIGLLHLALLAGLIRWSVTVKKPAASDIVWMEEATGEATSVAFQQPLPEAVAELTPPPAVAIEEGPAAQPSDENPGAPTPVKSELPLPAVTPKPTPTARPSITPSPKASPKAAPKKTAVAKASPKPSASPRKVVEAKTIPAKSAQRKIEPNETKNSAPLATSGTSAGSAGGRVEGAGGASQFDWYGNMLHDRFFSEWVQPKSLAMSGAKMSALVRVRIEKDGRVSDFNIVRSSGNVVVDESIGAVAKRVTQVDPLPSGLDGAGHYEVNIKFELNPE